MNNEGMYLVKIAKYDASSHRPFQKCISHSSSFVEFKFDFTDSNMCQMCVPKLLSTDHDNDVADPDEEEPELKARDEKAIAVYQNLILHPPKVKKKKCAF